MSGTFSLIACPVLLPFQLGKGNFLVFSGEDSHWSLRNEYILQTDLLVECGQYPQIYIMLLHYPYIGLLCKNNPWSGLKWGHFSRCEIGSAISFKLTMNTLRYDMRGAHWNETLVLFAWKSHQDRTVISLEYHIMTELNFNFELSWILYMQRQRCWPSWGA